MRQTYAGAIRSAHEYLLERHPEVFVIGQGLWSPWYVGETMTDLEVRFGAERVIDTPVSEAACTGIAIGAAVNGLRPLVVHPRVDFALLAVDQIVNQAAKWSSMFGGRSRVPVTFRCIVNRGGEQGAQHSQSLHGWFAHIPGLRVVMPYTPADARDLLVASVLSDDPVVFMDDRWLYDLDGEVPENPQQNLMGSGPRILRQGDDITLVGAGYSVALCVGAAASLASVGIGAEVVDLRVVNPLDLCPVLDSVRRTGRLLAVDGDWGPCGLAGEVIAAVCERSPSGALCAAPRRLVLPFAPAPTSRALESTYYPRVEDVVKAAQSVFEAE
jgi:acetoin:2,6-dichlorophenolindophenol oxidoreductase subunit beta